MANDQKPVRNFDESEIRVLLMGSEEQIAQALQIIESNLRARVCRRLRRDFPAISSEDIEDSWSETLAAALRAARRKRFQSNTVVRAWLHQVARSRVIDGTRRREVREETLAAYRVLVTTRFHLSDTSEQEKEDQTDLLTRLLETLPPRQRIVLRVFMEHHPQSENMEVLRQEVSEVTGVEETLSSVKRALQEVRRKARLWLHPPCDSRQAG
jgi:RNA polymerase sigma factor (sigma-70 family)